MTQPLTVRQNSAITVVITVVIAVVITPIIAVVIVVVITTDPASFYQLSRLLLDSAS